MVVWKSVVRKDSRKEWNGNGFLKTCLSSKSGPWKTQCGRILNRGIPVKNYYSKQSGFGQTLGGFLCEKEFLTGITLSRIHFYSKKKWLSYFSNNDPDENLPRATLSLKIPCYTFRSWIEFSDVWDQKRGRILRGDGIEILCIASNINEEPT